MNEVYFNKVLLDLQAPDRLSPKHFPYKTLRVKRYSMISKISNFGIRHTIVDKSIGLTYRVYESIL